MQKVRRGSGFWLYTRLIGTTTNSLVLFSHNYGNVRKCHTLPLWWTNWQLIYECTLIQNSLWQKQLSFMNSFDVPSVQESKNIIQANHCDEWRPALVRIILIFFSFASYLDIWMVFNILIFFPSQVWWGFPNGAEHNN